MTFRAAPLLLALVALGCTPGDRGAARAAAASRIPPAKIQPGKEADLMPLKVGNQWVYAYEQIVQLANGREDVKRETMTWSVVKATPIPGGTRAVVEVRANGKEVDRQTWRADGSGIYQEAISTKNLAYAPALPVLRFPVEANPRVKWSGRGVQPVGTVGPMDVDIQVLGSQEVDTDAGRMSAVAIESTSRFSVRARNGQSTKGMAANTAWYRPGVGLVRYRSEVAVGGVLGVTVLKLKSTNLKTI
jgi:hypothetical protein